MSNSNKNELGTQGTCTKIKKPIHFDSSTKNTRLLCQAWGAHNLGGKIISGQNLPIAGRMVGGKIQQNYFGPFLDVGEVWAVWQSS